MTVFDDVYREFEDAHVGRCWDDGPDRRLSNRPPIDWERFDVWREQLEASFPTLNAEDTRSAEATVHQLLVDGQATLSFHKLVFSTYCCGALLVRSASRSPLPILLVLDKFGQCVAGTGSTTRCAALRSSVAALVEQEALAIEAAIAVEVASGDFRHLGVTAAAGMRLGVQIAAVLPGTVASVLLLKELHQRTAGAVRVNLHQLITRFVSEHQDQIAIEVASEFATGDLQRLEFAAEHYLLWRRDVSQSLPSTAASLLSLEELHRRAAGVVRDNLPRLITRFFSEHQDQIAIEVASEFATGDLRHLGFAAKHDLLWRKDVSQSLPGTVAAVIALGALRDGLSQPTKEEVVRLLYRHVVEHRAAIARQIAYAITSLNTREIQPQLQLLVDHSESLGAEFGRWTRPTMAVIDALEAFPGNARDPRAQERARVVDELLHTDTEFVAEQVVSEIASGDTGRVPLLQRAQLFHVRVLNALLEHIRRSWLWDSGRAGRSQIALSDSDAVCKFVTSDAFSDRWPEVAQALLQVLHTGALTQITRHALLTAVGSIADESLVAQIVFELERQKFELEPLRKQERRVYEAAESKLAALRSQVVSRLPHELVDAATVAVGLLNELASKNEWGSKAQSDPARRHVLRHDLVETFRQMDGLLASFAHVLVVLYGDIEDDVVAVIAEAGGEDVLAAIRALVATMPDAESRLRARVILAHLDGTLLPLAAHPDRFSSISQTLAYYDSLIGSRGRAHGGYTWIEDETVERVIHRAFQLADERFAEFFGDNFQKYEPPLTERLLIYLEEEFRRIDSLLEHWSKGLRDGPIRIKLGYRDTQPEERVWNADVAFLLTCTVATRFSRSAAILAQCKKMNFDRNQLRLTGTWTVDTVQCQDLIARSPFSYYLMFGPRDGLATRTIVTPSSTVQALTRPLGSKGAVSKRSVAVTQLRPLSRTLADFMLYDFIGGWVGDERPEVVAWATGYMPGNAVQPRFLVTIDVTQGQ